MARKRTPALLALLVLAAVISLGAWAGLRQKAQNQAVVAARLQRLADGAAVDLKNRFRLYEYGLRGARGAVIAGGGAGTSRTRFLRYAESRDIAREFPGARGFGFIVRVPASREADFVRSARSDGAPAFKVRTLSPHAGERFVIQYIEPEAPNSQAVGLDIASEPTRREAALAAMNSGAATLTGPITLVQATGRSSRSMLLLLPVYEGPQTRPTGGRAAACIGWVYAPLVTDDILAGFSLANAEYGFSLKDLGSGETFFSSGGVDQTMEHSRDFSLNGRNWRVAIQARPAFLESLHLPDPLRLAAAIAGIGLLLALALYFFLVARERKRRSNSQRARLAAIVESSHDAIIGTNLEGRVTEWNRAAVKMFGYEPGEALGRTKVELIVPYERAREDERILRQVTEGRDVDLIDTVGRHRDGSLKDVEFSASPIKDDRGRVVGVAASLRDISERRAAQAEVLNLTASLEQQVEDRTAQLQAFSALQRAILDNAGYAIIATDQGGTITLFNPAAEAMLGYRSEEMVGVASPGMFHDPIEVAERAFVLERELGRPIAAGFETFIAKAAHEPDVNEWTYHTRSGERIPVLLNVSALRDGDGGISGYLGIAVNLSERKLREAALEINERKLRGLFELSPLGIALTDDQGQLVDGNDAFCALTGYSLEELRAMDYWALTPVEYKPQEKALRRVLMDTGRYGPYEKHFIRKDGSRVPARFNGLLLPIEGRPFIWTIAEDITLQRASEAAMVDAVAAAEAASKSKSDFLANMSHEIRTPMNAILGMLQLLRRTPLDPRQGDYAAKTESAAKTLLAILNDILDFSKIEAGRQTLESQEFQIDRLLRDIGVILSANVGEKDVEIVFDIAPDVPARVIGDSLRLQQVLINLTGNAVKFTHFGEIVLRVKQLDQSGNRVRLRFEVRDTGIGIDAQKLESIFEGFTQAEASTTRRFGGTGLGLAISQRLVRLMGGELSVESERGRGSCFHFAIDLELPEQCDETIGVMTAERLGALRALVVDDNDSARASIVDMVHSLGWMANAAGSGEEALELLERTDAAYDVVFLDWRMPGLDGWDTSQRIHAMHGESAAPLIIMVTAHGREALAERSAREHSVLDGFLVKPVTLSMLVDAVADARSVHVDAMSATGAVTAPRGPRRLAGLRVLVVDDNLNNQQVVAELLQDEGAHVTAAGGGAQALQILVSQGTPFDVVLMDIQMPDMDGYTATRRIRASPGLKALPIIAMTANVLPTDREACLAAGMNDHLGKPFELDTLVSRLQHWGGFADDAPPVAPSSATPHGTPAANTGASIGARLAVLDTEGALARFGGNRKAYDGALRRFVDGTDAMLGEVERLLQAGESESAELQLHTFRGLAGTVGADLLARTAATMEGAVRAGGTGVPGALAPLRAATAAAIVAARRSFEAAPAPAPVPAVAAGSSLPDKTLETLAGLLATSNLQALEVFSDFEQALAEAEPEVHRAMSSALDDLDFAAALAACRQLLRGGDTK
jgi:PAS domain S-box-containing protein